MYRITERPHVEAPCLTLLAASRLRLGHHWQLAQLRQLSAFTSAFTKKSTYLRELSASSTTRRICKNSAHWRELADLGAFGKTRILRAFQSSTSWKIEAYFASLYFALCGYFQVELCNSVLVASPRPVCRRVITVAERNLIELLIWQILHSKTA